jgi:sulfate transport system substrate-binding protein
LRSSLHHDGRKSCRSKFPPFPGKTHRLGLLPALAWLGIFSGCAPAQGRHSGAPTDTLTIGAYSVVREVFRHGILPAFAASWASRTGRQVHFEESYTGSGAQSRAIASGFDADVAVLSLEGDIDRLVQAGLVRKDWKSGPGGGMITRSLVVIGVRTGNPQKIEDWEDLTRPGVSVLYPDPKTSGGARWNINAIYGAGLLAKRSEGGAPDPSAGRDLLAKVQAHVIAMDSSGRQSMATFEQGNGDAIITYENELLLQRILTGTDMPYVIPPATLLIEGPAAMVEASVERHGNREVVAAFLEFLHSPEAQRIFSEYGFRPLDPRLDTGPARKPLPPRLFTMADLGGWPALTKTLYGPGGIWDSLFTRRKSSP